MEKYSLGPMSEKIRQIPRKWRPGHPPVNLGETLEELTLTLELFKILDAESQEYWGGDTMRKRLEQRIEQLKGELTSGAAKAALARQRRSRMPQDGRTQAGVYLTSGRTEKRRGNGRSDKIRNLPNFSEPDEWREIVGRRYNRRKKSKAEAGSIGGASKGQNDTCLQTTAEAIAAEHGVSPARKRGSN